MTTVIADTPLNPSNISKCCVVLGCTELSLNYLWDEINIRINYE